MARYISFEDNIFLLSLRIRMIRDLLRLDADGGLFLEKTLDDLKFIDDALENIFAGLSARTRLYDREGMFEDLSVAEWQFGQLLAEFAGEDNPLFASSGEKKRELLRSAREKTAALTENSAARRSAIEELAGAAEPEPAEPVVSPAELTGLLRGA